MCHLCYMKWLYKTNPVAKENHRIACQISEFKSGRRKNPPVLS